MLTEKFTYSVSNKTFYANIFFKQDWELPRPAVLIYHAFEGMNDQMAENAKRIVNMGFVAITLDMYGDGLVVETIEDCMQHCMSLIQDRDELHKRLLASVAAAKDHQHVDHSKVVAMGFCFGGLCVLDLARLGCDLAGVISVHGILAPPEKTSNKDITAKVLACHGFDDPQVPQQQIHDFMTEMNSANVDWQFVTYGHTKHAFSDPHAANIGSPEMGREYNPQTTERVWRLTHDFCHEAFKHGD